MLNLVKKQQPVKVEVDGDVVFVKPITAGQLAEVMHYAEVCKTSQTPWRTDFRLISMSVCDETGKPCLSEEEAENLTPQVASVLLAEVCKVNGLGQLDEKKESSEAIP